MAIQINLIAGVYEVNGELNSQNNKSLKNYFEVLMEQTNVLIISLNKNVKMTKEGISTLVSLYNAALIKNKKFRIIEMSNKQLKKQFKIAKKIIF
jgi:anti-anti-sigma regulatory factor